MWEVRILSARKRPLVSGNYGSNSDIAPIGLRFGLPVDRRQRLPKVYRRRDHDSINYCFPSEISLQRRLPPAVLGEESGWLLPESFVRNCLQVPGVSGGGEGLMAG